VVVDRHDAKARFRTQVELLADLAHVRVDRPGREVAASPPDRFLQVPARHQATEIPEERYCELELLRRELDLRPGLADLAALDVDLEGREGKLLLAFARIGAAKEGMQARHELGP